MISEWKNDFLKRFDLWETPPEGGQWWGSKKHFFLKLDFPVPDSRKSVFRVKKRFLLKVEYFWKLTVFHKIWSNRIGYEESESVADRKVRSSNSKSVFTKTMFLPIIVLEKNLTLFFSCWVRIQSQLFMKMTFLPSIVSTIKKKFFRFFFKKWKPYFFMFSSEPWSVSTKMIFSIQTTIRGSLD